MGLAFHEALDLHEILGHKTTCAARSASMVQMVSDPGLKRLLNADVQAATKHARDIQGLLQGSTVGGK